MSDYVVIDIETTGLDPRWDRIVELAAIRVRDGLIVDCYIRERHHRLIDVTARLNIADTVEHRALSDLINVYRCYEAMKQYATDNQVIISNLNKPASAREIKANVTTINQDTPIYGKSFTFTGTLEKMMQKDAMQKVVNMGGICALPLWKAGYCFEAWH